MPGQPSFDPIPGPAADWSVLWGSRVQTAVNLIMGKVNNGATITLTHGVTSTVMKDARLSAFSVLAFMPKTANAAAILASLWVDTQAKGLATIHHTSTVNTDQTFGVGIMG